MLHQAAGLNLGNFHLLHADFTFYIFAEVLDQSVSSYVILSRTNIRIISMEDDESRI